MDEIGGDPVLLRLIIKYVHHMNISFIAIQHSLWFKSLKENATVSYYSFLAAPNLSNNYTTIFRCAAHGSCVGARFRCCPQIFAPNPDF